MNSVALSPWPNKVFTTSITGVWRMEGNRFVALDPSTGLSDLRVGTIGRVHDRIRRAQQRESLYQEISGLYRDYTNLKARVQK